MLSLDCLTRFGSSFPSTLQIYSNFRDILEANGRGNLIHSVIFANNSGFKGGGALSSVQTSQMGLTNCTFTNNVSPIGKCAFHRSNLPKVA